MTTMTATDGSPTGDTQVDAASAGTAEGVGDGALFTVTVKAPDGSDVQKQVTLEELQKGYLRQADYTRKTQALKEAQQQLAEAKMLVDALEQNPIEAVRALAEAYNVELGTRPAPHPDGDDDAWGDDGGMDPTVAALRSEISELKNELQSIRHSQVRSTLEKEAERLTSRYGGDVDVDAVKRHMVTNGFPSLEAAYRDLYFDDVVETLKSSRVSDEEVVEQKRTASKVVTPGAASTAEGAVEKPKDSKLGIREAFFAALEEAGVSPSSDGESLGLGAL